jgi:hypothetical protein
VLTNTNLTSWREQGVATISVGSLMRALERVQRRDPSLPISQLMRQDELVALLKNFRNFNLQLDAEDEANEQAISAGSQQMRDRMAPGDIRLGKKLLQYNKHQQASASGGYAPAPAPATAEKPPAVVITLPPAAPAPAAASGARDPADMPLVPQKPQQPPGADEAQFFTGTAAKTAPAPAAGAADSQPAGAAAAPQQQVPGGDEAQFFTGTPPKAPAPAAGTADTKTTAAAPQQVPGGDEAQFFMDPPGKTTGGSTAAAGTPAAAAAAASQQVPGGEEAQFFIDPKSAPAPGADSKQPAQKEPEIVVDPPAFTGDRPQGLPAAVAEVAEAAAAQAAAEAVPVKSDKPALPPGVKAGVGNGLLSEPISWWVPLKQMCLFELEMRCCYRRAVCIHDDQPSTR